MKNLVELAEDLLVEMKEWRHHLHSNPETAFEEYQTADFVAEKLESFGIKTNRGMAKTGVIGTLQRGDSNENTSIALRADMDALAIEEKNDIGYRSKNKGKMHACGHDGHMAMLLGAAKLMSSVDVFKGTVHFIFQPAEENLGGGGVMVEEGLFDKFPAKAVFGMHNFPTLPAGLFAIHKGPMMAAYDVFDIDVKGVGGHAAMPQFAKDPIITAATIVSQLQTLVSRNTNPLESSVVSVTEIHAGTAYNIIPDLVKIRGTTRHFKPEIQDMIENGLKQIAKGIAEATGTTADVLYQRRYPALVNTEKESQLAVEAAAGVVGTERVDDQFQPLMGSEDFAFMLQKKPGAYIGIGSGSTHHSANLHQATYDFNDSILSLGAAYWVSLVKTVLAN